MKIAAVFVCALAWAGCKEREQVPARASTPPPIVTGDAAGPQRMRLAGPRLEARGGIDLSAAPAKPAKRSPVTACKLPGAGWSWPCGSRSFGHLAFDGGGRLYLTDADGGLRRYTVHTEDGCRLEEDAGFGDDGRLAPPPERPVGQRLEGRVHLRSGGPEWRLGSADGAVYWHDFLLGVYRVDRGKLAPVCPDLTGVRQITGDASGVLMVVDRRIERLTRAKGCKRQEVMTGEAPAPVVGLVGGALHVTDRAGGERVVNRLGKDLEPQVSFAGVDAFDPGGLCSVVGIAGCGDHLCVADNNCQQVNRYAADGRFVDRLRLGDVLDGAVFAVRALAAAPGGAVLVTAEVRNDDTCSARILRIAGDQP